MQFPSLQAWLGWLEQCHPKEIDLGLERIRQVAECLNLLTTDARVVTVAGTNGKGSCVTATAALLRASGLRVGLYTSPHLIHYNERIQVNGVNASDAEICDAFAAIAQASGDISLTYFEYGTLAALEIFRHHKVDAMVLEVGLGGRLDAVNILSPDVAVITSIALDHQDWLGDNREAIGAEKAGIMRSKRPVICADPEPPASLRNTAENLGAYWYAVNETFEYSVGVNGWCWWGQGADNARLELTLNSLPRLPLQSLAAALQAVFLLGIDLTALPVAQILGNLKIPGRFQSLTWLGRDVILDVAHNPAASAYLRQRLQDSPCQGRTIAVVAMMADKDRVNSLRNLSPVIDSWYLGDLADIPRAATVKQLESDLASLNLLAEGRGTVAQCLETICKSAAQQDRVVVWGSFYTVAAALAVLQPQEQAGGWQ